MKTGREEIKIGLIGCGYWGPNFVRIVNNSNEAELVAVCDLDAAKLDRLQGKFPGLLLCENAEDIFANPTIDAVIICTPVDAHFDLSKRALLAGKHVLCEKPLAFSVAECNLLKEAADFSGKTLMVGHVFEYNAVVRYMQDMVDSKKIGDVLYLSLIRTGLGPVRTDVNVTYDLASHDISILLALLHQMPVSVTAMGTSFIRSGVEDVAFIHLEFPHKVMASISVSWIDPIKQRIVKVVGSKKMLLFDDVSNSEKLKVIETGRDYQTTTGDYGSFQLSLKDGEIVIPNIPHPEPLLTEFNHFLNCIRGAEKPLTDVESAARVVRVLEAVTASLNNQSAKIFL